MNLSSAGAISGTPTTASASSFTVTATDSATPPQTKTQGLSITVNPVLSITTTSLPSGTVATAYSQNILTSGGTLPIAWSVSTGTLPAGLTLAGNASGVRSSFRHAHGLWQLHFHGHGDGFQHSANRVSVSS